MVGNIVKLVFQSFAQRGVSKSVMNEVVRTAWKERGEIMIPFGLCGMYVGRARSTHRAAITLQRVSRCRTIAATSSRSPYRATRLTLFVHTRV